MFPKSTSVTSQLLLSAGVSLCAAECWIPHSKKKRVGGRDSWSFKEQFFCGLLAVDMYQRVMALIRLGRVIDSMLIDSQMNKTRQRAEYGTAAEDRCLE